MMFEDRFRPGMRFTIVARQPVYVVLERSGFMVRYQNETTGSKRCSVVDYLAYYGNEVNDEPDVEVDLLPGGVPGSGDHRPSPPVKVESCPWCGRDY